MSRHRERYPFIQRDATAGLASSAPLLPFRARLGAKQETCVGLIDTGAAVNVVPWSVGQSLEGNWDASPPVILSGNLAKVEARILVVDAIVGSFAPRRLAFAWSKSDAVPVLLGQVNFLSEFDVHLSRSGGWFEIIEPEKSL